MATKFISKFLSYGITLPSKKTARFRDRQFITSDTELAEELRQSPAHGRDFEEIVENSPAEGGEGESKGKKK